MTLLHHSDPSHGWLEVPLDLMREIRVSASSYSYVHGTDAYLEEDEDAPKFLRAAEAAGYTFTIKESHTDRDSPIRRYRRWGY